MEAEPGGKSDDEADVRFGIRPVMDPSLESSRKLQLHSLHRGVGAGRVQGGRKGARPDPSTRAAPARLAAAPPRRRILRRLRGGVFRNSPAARGRRPDRLPGGARGMRRLRADVRRALYTLIAFEYKH